MSDHKFYAPNGKGDSYYILQMESYFAEQTGNVATKTISVNQRVLFLSTSIRLSNWIITNIHTNDNFMLYPIYQITTLSSNEQEKQLETKL